LATLRLAILLGFVDRNVELAAGEGAASAVPCSSGACSGSTKYQLTSATAAAWRDFMRSVYQNTEAPEVGIG